MDGVGGGKRLKAGPVVTHVEASSILTRATGFMADYDFTLNPYSGCTFACGYCYAAAFARPPADDLEWGRWVTVKDNAVEKLRRMRTPLEGRRIYMSSVTDPYQPIERRLELTRSLLQVLVDRQPVLVVQTRAPLVTRDLDLLGELTDVRVNMTVTTDDHAVHKTFEPDCPPTPPRLRAIRAVVDAGIPAAITLTPLLPIMDVDTFAADLLATGVQHFVVQPFHPPRGRFAAGTRAAARPLIQRYAWDEWAYRRTVDRLHELLPDVREGRGGFAP